MERFVLSLAQDLPRERIDLRVYSLLPDNPWLSEFESKGIRVQVFSADNRPGLASIPNNALALLRLAWRMRKDRIDIVHTPDFFPAAMGRIASLLAGVPSRVHTLHSVYEWYPEPVHKLQSFLGRFTDVVTAVSTPALEHSLDNVSIPPEKYKLIHNGADETRFRPDAKGRLAWRARNGWKESDILVGSVGSRTPRKGHPLLMEALAPLMVEDHRIHLVIVGPSNHRETDTRPVVERIAKEAGVVERVHFLPPCSDVENVFRCFDIHCMPSQVEGMSFSALEGILSGAISVFSDLPVFREVVEDGKCGFLFRPGDPVALREALRAAMDTKATDPAWTDRARATLIRGFSQSRMVEQFATLYEDLAKRNGLHR